MFTIMGQTPTNENEYQEKEKNLLPNLQKEQMEVLRAVSGLRAFRESEQELGMSFRHGLNIRKVESNIFWLWV